MTHAMHSSSSQQSRRWVGLTHWSHSLTSLCSFTQQLLSEAHCLCQASTALLLDGMNVFDRVIKVNMARGGSGPGVVRSLDPDRVQRTVHVGGLPFDEISEETLSEYFSHVGEVCASSSAVSSAVVRIGGQDVSLQNSASVASRKSLTPL